MSLPLGRGALVAQRGGRWDDGVYTVNEVAWKTEAWCEQAPLARAGAGAEGQAGGQPGRGAAGQAGLGGGPRGGHPVAGWRRLAPPDSPRSPAPGPNIGPCSGRLTRRCSWNRYSYLTAAFSWVLRIASLLKPYRYIDTSMYIYVVDPLLFEAMTRR